MSGLKGLGRGAVGCFTILVALALLGAVLSALEGPGATPGPKPSTVVRTNAPGSSPVEPQTPEPVATEPPGLQMTLRDALEAGLVSMTAEGRSLQELVLTLESKSDQGLAIEIPVGLVFRPGASGTQSMVVISPDVLELLPFDTDGIVLDVACASMTKDTPGTSDRFTLSTTPASTALRKLVATPGFAEADFRVQQFAIWTITNNPTRNGYVGLGTLGVGSGPSSAEIREIKALFVEAGIDTSKYRALR